MAKIHDLTGKRFGRLVAIEPFGKSKDQHVLWRCKCDCGGECYVASNHLTKGGTKSCGCFKSEILKKGQKTIADMMRKHGESGTRLYHIWLMAIRRCENPSDKSYKDYGARGISFYEAWKNDFFLFKSWALANGYMDDLEIDRIDNEKGYSPQNCRWVTKIQNANNKRNNVKITSGTETHTIAEWGRITGVNPDVIRGRIKYGWTTDKALFTPTRKRRKKEKQ